jgi:dipeptidase E
MSPPEVRRILAMGGGGFTMPDHDQSDALDRLILDLTGRQCPKVCFLPTASGDERALITRFYERFNAWPCQPSVLSLFTLGRERIDPAAEILRQDAIYVGGGSLRNMLAIWREHGIDQALRTAWERGIVLAGLSAGAMCWFTGGVSTSGGRPQSVNGLGLLPGSLSVHMDGESQRLPVFEEAIAAGELPGGYAADDGAALVFAGAELQECVVSREDARVVAVTADRRGGVIKRRLPARVLTHAIRREQGHSIREPYGVSELRALRGGPNRWE